MPRKCVVKSCLQNVNGPVHVIPKEPHKKVEWLEEVGRYDLSDLPSDKLKKYGICHLHFPKQMYCLPAVNPRLRSDAKPTVNLGDDGCTEPSAFHTPTIVDENSRVTNEMPPSNTVEPKIILEPAESPLSSDTCKANIASEPVEIPQSQVTSEPNNDTRENDISLSRILCDSNNERNVSLQDDFLPSNRPFEPNSDVQPGEISPSSSISEPEMCQEDCFQSRIVAVSNDDSESSERRMKWRSVGRVSYLCKNAQMYHRLWTKLKKQQIYDRKKGNALYKEVQRLKKIASKVKIDPDTITKEALLQLVHENFHKLTNVHEQIMYGMLVEGKHK